MFPRGPNDQSQHSTPRTFLSISAIWKTPGVFRRINQKQFRGSSSSPRSGFTLIELLISSLIISVVILVAWSGLISIRHSGRVSHAAALRRSELNQALDFISNDIQKAQGINQTNSIEADGVTVTVEDVVQNAGINLSNLGPYGEIALYLEIPTDQSVTVCPTATRTTLPAESVDRVVYDIRDSTTEWLGPKSVMRYGRLIDENGLINPCSQPFAGDIMADAITDQEETPTCNGILTGRQGFHICKEGSSTQLLLKSAIDEVNQTPMQRKVSSRIMTVTPEPPPPEEPPVLVLTLSNYNIPFPGQSTVDLDWVWQGSKADDMNSSGSISYTLRGGGIIELSYPPGSDRNALFSLGTVPGSGCFTIDANTPEDGIISSNTACINEGVIQ